MAKLERLSYSYVVLYSWCSLCSSVLTTRSIETGHVRIRGQFDSVVTWWSSGCALSASLSRETESPRAVLQQEERWENSETPFIRLRRLV